MQHPPFLTELFLFVVCFTGGNLNDITFECSINQAIALINSTRPPTRAIITKRFGFPYACMTIALDVFNEQIDPFQGLFILILPG